MSVALLDFESTIAKNGGQLFDYGRDGLLILDRTGKRITHVCRDNEEEINAESLDIVRSFLADTEECIERCKKGCNGIGHAPKTQINCDVALLSDSLSGDAFFAAVGKLGETHDVTLRFHFNSPPPSWYELFERHVDFLKKRPEEKKLVLQIYGTFTQMTEVDKNFLFDQNCQLHFVHDSVTFSPVIRETALDFAEYGFHVPFVWHIHGENVKKISSIIDEAMNINHNSGFSLPLISESFYKKTLSLPSLDYYLQLLIDLYSRYPFYDKVFYPLNAALDASLGKPSDSMPLIYQWNECNSSLTRVFPPSEVEQAHSFFVRSFLWQRWLVVKAFQDVPSCEYQCNNLT